MSVPKASLAGADGRFAIALALRFRVTSSDIRNEYWEIQTFAYSYLLFRDDREFVAYHWNSEGLGADAVLTPHVHFGKELPHPEMPAADRERITSLAAAHHPTGTIAFTSILRMAMREFGVAPLDRQEETPERSLILADADLTEAEAALDESFEWSRGRRTMLRNLE